MSGGTRYPNLGSTRWVVQVELGAGKVVLDDGSQWRLDGTLSAEQWQKTTKVTVEPTIETSEAEFVLRASGYGGVPAELLGFGPLGGPGT